MKVKYALFLLSFILVLFACKSEVDELAKAPDAPKIDIVDPDGIVGTWQWESTNAGGVIGGITTPETEGRTSQLSLRNDGTVTWYGDYNKSREGTYRLKDTILERDGSVTMIRFNDDSFVSCYQVSISEDNSKICIQNKCMVAPSGTCYSRISK